MPNWDYRLSIRRCFLIFTCLGILLHSAEAFQGTYFPFSKACPIHSSAKSKTIVQYTDGEKYLDSLKPKFRTTVSRSELFQNGNKIGAVSEIMLAQILILLGSAMVTITALVFTGNNPDLNDICWTEVGCSRPSFNIDIWIFIEGILAAVPAIFSMERIAKSNNREFTLFNFPMTEKVMSLFGRRLKNHRNHEEEIIDPPASQPANPMIRTLLLLLMISTMTGVCEEIVFRVLIPYGILNCSHSLVLTFISQAALFGLGHVSPKDPKSEDKTFIILQTFLGLWYGSVYLLAGGNILPSIIAHSLYESHILLKTWVHINDQIDYTENAVLEQLTMKDKTELRKLKQETSQSLSVETCAFLRRFFYAFDYDRIGSLSKLDVQRAVSYAFMNDTEKPSEERIEEFFTKTLSSRLQMSSDDSSPRLRLPEFLRLIIFLRESPTIAI